MVVRGIVFGIPIFGNVTTAQLARFAEVAKTVELLRKQLAEVFDSQVADAVVSRMGETNATVEDGSLPIEIEERLEYLASIGIGRKAKE